MSTSQPVDEEELPNFSLGLEFLNSKKGAREVWRALKRLELHSDAPRATLTPLSCSPNFLRAQYLDIRMLTHELIVKCHESFQT